MKADVHIYDQNNPIINNNGIISKFVKNLTNSPGVYRMLDKDGHVLYVGKARNLQKRVASYTQNKGHSIRIKNMINQTANMEFITTHTEVEALLLEANLIKQLRPRFNVLMRDDKSFPYILITEGGKTASALYKHRGAHLKKGDYFGPFASTSAVERTINSLQRAFLLRTCSDSVFNCRTRPCLLFQIKRCSGPCTQEISNEEYEKLVNEAKSFLSGHSKNIKKEIACAMNKAANQENFESAAMYRDRLAALSYIQNHHDISIDTHETTDVFALYHEGGISCIQVFFFRFKQNWGNRTYFLKGDTQLSKAQVLSSFLTQFYDDKTCPQNILLSDNIEDIDLLKAAFYYKSGHKVKIIVPHQGKKRELVEQALMNSREAHKQKFAEETLQKQLLENFSKTFSLTYIPKRIEIYDNSHIMGSNAVGVVVVAGVEGFIKNQYRKFNICLNDINPGDDCGMMREVIKRRFQRLMKETPKFNSSAQSNNNISFPKWPDVLIIDGGQGQVNAVYSTLKDLGIQDYLTVIGIAKGPNRNAGFDRFFTQQKKYFVLAPRSAVLYFIQRLRDEAHRFAITTHRTNRKKGLIHSPLNDIPNIGPSRKHALLQYFGTIKEISNATPDDLAAVNGISKKIAHKIHSYFHKSDNY
ncbi:Excinuclease ABC subunit C [Liberibacter crescens BT-1]|uniref:UvrABC system protein C n=1 Tax=Liberibacter crescens (strain BT-1) TaxID=1215343 RepID=L0EUC1_LIBCB|nr:Excinuclease ABC subunit C [Liberibacter crescens BT-1]